MTIIISVACVAIAFFFYPIQTLNWIGEKAKSRFVAWKSLFSKKEGK
jgi:hypothetical protein